MNSYHTGLFALSIKMVNNSFYSFCYRTHSYYDVFGIFGTIINEWSIFSTTQSTDLFHIISHYVGNSFIIFVLTFASLEINVAVLSCTSCYRMFGVKSIVAISFQCVLVYKLSQFILIGSFYFLYFVRSTETIKEVQERHTTLDSSQVSNRS